MLFATVGALRVEPLVANGDPNGAQRHFCATDDAGPAPLSLAGISATTASATTRIASVAPANQQPASTATIENLSIGGPVGTLLTAQAVTSSAGASCIGLARQLSGGSRVVAAKVLWAPVTADGVLTIVGNVVNGLPTGQVLTVRFNQQQRTATGLTQRAVEVQLKAGSTVLVSAVAGETKVSAQGDVCSATSGGGGGGAGGGSGGSGGSGGGGSGSRSGPGAKPCPVGSTYERAARLCVILRTSAGGRTERIVVGKPCDGPSGGRVVALVDLPRSLRGTVCAKGKGPKFAILGTNGADRITGTNRADRIMTLGGKARPRAVAETTASTAGPAAERCPATRARTPSSAARAGTPSRAARMRTGWRASAAPTGSRRTSARTGLTRGRGTTS